MAADELQYFLNLKRTILVASFVGKISDQNQHVLKKCLEEIGKRKELCHVILNLQGVVDFDAGAIRAFAILQSTLRENYELKICCVSDELKRVLATSGVIREKESQKDLASSLQTILREEKSK